MATYQIPPPSPMSLKGDVVEQWKEFENAWDDYLIATELDKKLTLENGDASPQGMAIVAATLSSVMGAECRKVMNNLPNLTADGRKKPDEIIKALNAYFIPQRNILYERFIFNSATQKPSESIDEFVIRLRQLAESCEFGDLRDSLIRDRIVIGTSDESGRERILRARPTPELNAVVENLRAAEMCRSHKQVMSGKNEGDSVDYIGRRKGKNESQGSGRYKSQGQRRYQGQGHQQASAPNRPNQRSQGHRACYWCGEDVKHFRRDCPARNSKCSACKRMGHYAKACMGNVTAEIEEEEDDSPDEYYLGEVNSINNNSDDFWSADIEVNGESTTFKLDSGSKITVVGEKTPWLKQQKMEECTAQFRGPGMVSLSHLMLGEIRNGKLHINGREITETVYVMKGQPKNLLSKAAIQRLQLLKPDPVVYNVESEANFRMEYPELFTGLGLTKEAYTIPLKQDAVPVCIYTARRVPHPLLPQVEKQLDKMKKQGVISAVTEPTEWCSGMVIAPKPNGQIRLCVDLTPLNKAVRREIHPMATVDENLAKLQGSQVFSKLDANSGFWQIPLNPSSRLLTTFVTPFGRFCFNRLPFGISSAPEIFQRTMSSILEGCEGVICHMDDILIHGPSQEIHDQRVRRVLSKLKSAGLTLNEKCEFSKTELTFLGHVITPEGIAADPQKTLAVQNFPTPENVTDLQRFNGMVNQLAKFLPNLAKLNEPLRQLLRKEQHWVWDQPQERAFQQIKEKLTSPEVLAHYDPNSRCIVAADASQNGLGAVLLQTDSEGNRRPISYASRSLSDTEKRYAVIEKEALAATWACEKFSDYILGTTFSLETDHRPLVPLLSSTDLAKLPARILRFRLRLMRYCPEMFYVQGKNQNTADALSRAPSSKPTKQDLILVEEVEEFKDAVIRNLPASDNRLQQIVESQEKDAVCTQVKEYVDQGWPPIMPSIPLMKPYWENRHHLTINDGLLMYDTRIVIPQSMQLGTLQQVHAGHLGMTKCKGRAHNSVWWPSITSQIESMCNRCATCTLHKPEKREPLLPLSTPESVPWSRIGTDLFEYQKREYLVIVDYGSRWLDFKELSSTTSQAVIRTLSEVFATHGTPSVVMSDNGPQFSSQEFQQFARDWGFDHVTSSPRYPQANGAAERAVQTAKKILKKNDNPYLGLLAYRSAPLQCGKTPSQLLMSRLLRTNVPTVPGNLTPKVIDKDLFTKTDEAYKNQYKKKYDERHRAVSLPCLRPGDKVFVRDQMRHGEVTERLNSPRSYKITTETGNTIRRNRRALIHTGLDSETPQPDSSAVASPPRYHQNPENPASPASTLPDKTSIPENTPTEQPAFEPRRSGRSVKPTQHPDMVYYK
jgi:hypothetical protein